MKYLLITTALLSAMTFTTTSCKKDKEEDPTLVTTNTPAIVTIDNSVTASGFTKTILENPSANQIIGNIVASTNTGTLVYSIKSQVPAGAFYINSVNGQLLVSETSKFDFETNTTLTATVEVSNGTKIAVTNVTVTLTDVNEGTVATIGDFRDGGIVFWVDPSDNTKGLVVGLNDLGSGAEWGCSGTKLSGADATAIGTGAQNTIDIEAGCATTGTAADLCANSTADSYSDWFSPSIDELKELYDNKATVNPAITTNSGTAIANAHYWSSSQTNLNSAKSMYFSGGNINTTANKNQNLIKVRAVRAF